MVQPDVELLQIRHFEATEDLHRLNIIIGQIDPPKEREVNFPHASEYSWAVIVALVMHVVPMPSY